MYVPACHLAHTSCSPLIQICPCCCTALNTPYPMPCLACTTSNEHLSLTLWLPFAPITFCTYTFTSCNFVTDLLLPPTLLHVRRVMLTLCFRTAASSTDLLLRRTTRQSQTAGSPLCCAKGGSMSNTAFPRRSPSPQSNSLSMSHMPMSQSSPDGPRALDGAVDPR